MKYKQREGPRYLSVQSEADLDFISGFPCTRFQCHGTLQKDGYEGNMAIVCASCEEVFYVLHSEK